jgi:hypothetical protein
MRRPTCAQIDKREEFGWPVGRNQRVPTISEIRTAREPRTAWPFAATKSPEHVWALGGCPSNSFDKALICGVVVAHRFSFYPQICP